MTFNFLEPVASINTLKLLTSAEQQRVRTRLYNNRILLYTLGKDHVIILMHRVYPLVGHGTVAWNPATLSCEVDHTNLEQSTICWPCTL